MNHWELSKYYLNWKIEIFTKEDTLQLNKLLAYHSDLYYNQETPIISDFEYDSLFKKLKILEDIFSLRESFTQNVGSDILSSTFEKVAHSHPMISLDNTYNEEDLRDFDERVQKLVNDSSEKIVYSLEFKFDWLGVELIYKNWKLVQALTRWNGVIWEDVTQNILTIKNIPKTIDYQDELEIRWEVVMPISSFEKLNEAAFSNGEKIFSNPRNAASGSLRLLDSSITEKRNLKYFAYDIANMEAFRIKENKTTYQDIIHSLENFGFEISSYFPLCENIEDVISHIKNFWDMKSKIDFDIDGLVLKTNQIHLWQQIGFTQHHPRYAIAYKFPAEIVTTKILSVDHQVGRTGTITPVANLEPVNIWWVVVKRVTLHNYDEINKLWVMIWDSVFIKRAGEVIPKVVWVITETRNWNEFSIDTPIFCPSCHTKLEKDIDKVRYYCPNTLWCRAQIIEKLINSVWKWGLNIDGLWKEQIELFYTQWFITDISSIYELKSKQAELLTLPWYKEKSITNLLESIEKSKNVEIVHFLVALNIPGIGKAGAKELSKFIESKDELIHFNHSIEELETINDIWELTAKTLFEYFHNEANIQNLKKLLNYITLAFRKEIIWWKYNGIKMCITGSFEGYSRDQLISLLEKEGGSFVSSVSVKTDSLLAGEKAGSKLKKAQELWVKIINLEEFLWE